MPEYTPTQRLQALPPYLFAEMDRLKQEQIKKGADIISLGIGDPDLPRPRTSSRRWPTPLPIRPITSIRPTRACSRSARPPPTGTGYASA